MTCRLTHEIDGVVEKIEWNANVFSRIFKKSTFEPYTQLNGYWEQLPKKDQDRIFKLFLEAKTICNTIYDVKTLTLTLRPIVLEILKLHDTEAFERWTRFFANIWIPNELDSEYVQDYERPRSREQTYVVGDFWELVFMLMKLHAIAPIWGEYCERIGRECGTATEMMAYCLIIGSEVDQSPAMDRLRAYVAKNVKEADHTASASVKGTGNEDFHKTLIADILVRYLVLANLTNEGNETHLVQIVHKTLRNRLSVNDNHQTAILPKQNPRDESDSEDASSRAEKYKAKPKVAPGLFVVMEYETEFMGNIAAKLIGVDRLDRDDQRLLDEAHDAAMQTLAYPMANCQIRLIQIVINPVVVSRALWDINKAALVRLAAVAQFVLWKAGFKDLAGIVTARSHSGTDDLQYATESRSHIPKELQKRLDELYPFQKRHPFKKNQKVVNDAVLEIMALSSELSEHTWYLNMNDDLVRESRGSSVNRTYRVGQDIRVRLSELVIFIQERNAAFIKKQYS